MLLLQYNLKTRFFTVKISHSVFHSRILIRNRNALEILLIFGVEQIIFAVVSSKPQKYLKIMGINSNQSFHINNEP